MRCLTTLKILTVLTLGLVACSEDAMVEDTGPDNQNTTFAAAAETANEVATVTALTTTVVAAAAYDPSLGVSKDSTVPCPEVSVGAEQANRSFTITLDAGTGCALNSVTYRGVVSISVQLKPLGGTGTTTATATFDNFYADAQQVDGTISLAYTVSGGTVTGTATTDLALTDQDEQVSIDADLNIVVRTGQPLTLEDDTSEITGTADLDYTNYEDVLAASIEISDSAPLTFIGGCPFPVSGTFEADATGQDRSLANVLVNFSPEQGACDTIVAITLSGVTRTYDFTEIGTSN